MSISTVAIRHRQPHLDFFVHVFLQQSAQGQALVDAAKDGDLREVSRLLIQPGVDKNYRDKVSCNYLLLLFICFSGGPCIYQVYALLLMGFRNCVVEVSHSSLCVICICLQWGSTALMLAAGQGHLEVVRTLLQAGALVNIQAKVSEGVCIAE